MNLFKFITVLVLLSTQITYGQNYTSLGDGTWTTPAKWNNTSGWGTSTPPVDGSHGSGTITMQNNMSISGNYTTGSPTLNITAGKTLTVNGNLTETGGATINVYGTLVVTGNMSLSSTLTIQPGGKVIVNGSVVVVSANNLIVGTGATPPPYADLVIYQNLTSQSSGDVTLNKNARVALFGNLGDDGAGGTILQLNNGAQMYVNGNVAFNGGGAHINNANTVNPFGLYVNGTTTNSGGGSTTTPNEANKATLQATNLPFYNWVSGQPGSPLPVTLLYFRVESISETGISLAWATASELNFDHFEIEKSTNGQTFSTVASIKGNGTTPVRHTYSWTDTNPVNGTNYYRLKSVDFDGFTETFNLVIAETKSERRASVYPNPVADQTLHIDLNFEPGGTAQVVLFDVFGNPRHSYSPTEFQSITRLSVEPGTYIVQVRSGSFLYTERIIVQ